MATPASALNYTLSQATLLKCHAEQQLSHEKNKAGTTRVTIKTQITKSEEETNTLFFIVTATMAGTTKESGLTAFITECSYKQTALFYNNAPDEKDIETSMAEQMLKPLYFFALNKCQELAWDMGYPIARRIPAIELFSPHNAPDITKPSQSKRAKSAKSQRKKSEQ